MADDTLYIGDVVSLYNTDSNGFVFSSQSSSQHNEVAVGSKQSKRKPNVKDPKFLTFEVCAAKRYKLNKKFRELKTKSDGNPGNQSLQTQLQHAQLAAKAEEEDNDLEQKRQQGKKLLYGQIIQLKHRFTFKYLHVSTSALSQTEGTHMAVSLQTYNAKHAQFRVMPRYKVKTDGDVVQEDDQIHFESVKAPGHYLHVSEAQFGGASVYKKSCELNMSVQKTTFTMHRYYKPEPEDKEKVKMGDFVRLYHIEMEAYMVAEGLFDYELTDDVHMKLKPIVQSNPKSMLPSSSANTFWQLELQEGCLVGGVLKWEQNCRLLHMCTRKYLCLGSNGEVTLTSDHLDPKSVFRLHQVNKEIDDMPQNSHCRIEHVASKQWLHASTVAYKRKDERGSERDSNSMGFLGLSTAQTKKVTVVDEQRYDDVFIIQAVDPALQSSFSFMTGMVPFIQKLVQDKRDGVRLTAEVLQSAVGAFQEISQFIVVDGEAIKQRQKMMKELRIVELLVSFLKCPLNGSDQYDVTRAVYEVLHTYLLGRSRQNKLYIAGYIDFFVTQFKIKEGGIGLNAVRIVMETIRDNKDIVDRLTHDHIDAFVELLLLEKNYRYLELLSVLCFCDGECMPDYQNRINEAWLITNGMRCVFHMKLDTNSGSTGEAVFISTNNGRSWIDLITFAKDRDAEDYLFLEYQLKLFEYLSRGQNANTISFITRDCLTWAVAFKCLCDENLPEQLRALCCDLIISLFVDTEGKHSVVDTVKLCYAFDEIRNDEKSQQLVVSSQSMTCKYFQQISKWISDFLSKNKEMTASEIGKNILIKQVLRLVHILLKFGLYGNIKDIRELLYPLMCLLDGRRDKPCQNDEGKEDQEQLNKFSQSERFKPSPETKAIVEAKNQALDVLDLILRLNSNVRLERFLFMFKSTHQEGHHSECRSLLAPLLDERFDLENSIGIALEGNTKLADIFDKAALLEQGTIVDILMDLSRYEYDDIVRKSMHLLNRWFSAYQNLFQRSALTQMLIADESITMYKRAAQLVPELSSLATNKMEKLQANDMTMKLKELQSFCHLTGEEEEPHPVNQSILYKSGIMEVMFTILSKEIDEKTLEDYSGLPSVFEETFVLLKLLARNNPVVQGRLYDRLDLLLSTKFGFIQMAELVTEIFTGNAKTCMMITEQQVERIMKLVVSHQSDVPEFLNILKAVIRIDELDLPLKRNQSIVMSLFVQNSQEGASIIYENENARMNLLTSSDTQERDFLISVVDLLATCAEGENKYAETFCQTIFKIPEILTVLNNHKINSSAKRPYLQFFISVYLHTANAEDIFHDTQIWNYVKCIKKSFSTVKKYTRKHSEVMEQMLKKPPKKGFSAGNELEETIETLHYMFDAVMPFMQIFCRRYHEKDREHYTDKIKYLANSYETFVDVVMDVVSVEKQMQRLVTCMSLLFSTDALDSNKMAAFQAKYSACLGNLNDQSLAKKTYDEKYAKEGEINNKLCVFVMNMKTVYGGINDVQTQTSFPSKRGYSWTGEDEDLPLGEEFQAHMNIFIDHNTGSPKEKYRHSEKLIRQLLISTKRTTLSEKERMDQLDLDLKCMRLLRGMLHNQIIKLPEDYTYSLQSYKKQLNVIEGVQNAMIGYGSIAGTLAHLTRPEDDIVRETLAFLAALLFNGNSAVQTTLFECFTSTKEETFFHTLKHRIVLSTVEIREQLISQALWQVKIDETNDKEKALRGDLRNDSLADKGVASLRRTLITSLTSMKRSITASSDAQGRRKNSRAIMNVSANDSTTTTSQLYQTNMPNGRTGSSSPDSLELTTVNGRTIRDESPGMSSNNRIVPAAEVIIADENVPIEDDSEKLRKDDLPEFDFIDGGCLQLDLKILGLMCGINESALQDYIGEQPGNVKSVNIVTEIMKVLNSMYAHVNADSIAVITGIFETLVELTAGNNTNKVVVFDNRICDYIIHILRVNEYKGCTNRQVYTMKKVMGYLVRCLTEENPSAENEPTSNLPKEVMEIMGTDVMVTVMTEAKMLCETNEEKELRTLLQVVGFQYYHLLARKLDLYPESDHSSILKTKEEKSAFEYYAGKTLSIEIVKDDVLQKLYFQVKDKRVLRKEIKERVTYEVDRSSQCNKIRDFMDWTRDIINDINHRKRVSINPLGRLLLYAWLPLNYSTLFVTVLLCVCVTVTWKQGETGVFRYNPSFRFRDTDVAVVIYVFGGIHIFLSLALFYSYIIANRPVFPSVADINSWWRGRNDGQNKQEDSWTDKNEKSKLEVNVYGFKPIYYLLFLLCSIAGTATKGYFFALHLLHIVELIRPLKRIIKAVATKGLSLLLVALLGLVVLYIYSFILFAFYGEWMWSAEDGRHCNAIYECFVSILHHGLVAGPYNQFEAQMGRSFNQAIGITFFDVSFFVIITTIGLYIILGIVVDSISQLRRSKSKISKDTQTKCFICCRDSYDFHKQGGVESFSRHVTLEHNMWTYLYFFIHLDETRPNDYSPLERYVHRLLVKKNFDFFPLGQALSLEDKANAVLTKR